jgi:DNA-binding MarR family transcriptional regulator
MSEEPIDEFIGEMVGECLAVRIRALNRAVTALYDEALRPFGLRVGQMNLMVAIARMGTARPGDLCRVLCMERSTLSRDVEVMRRHGWLEVVDSAGGRTRPLQLTAKGQALLLAARPAWRSAQAKARALLGEEGSASIIRVVDRLWSGEGTRP